MSKDSRVFSEEQRQLFFKAINHHHRRRALFHDYTSRATYMVTLNKSAATPILATLPDEHLDPNRPPETIPTEVGLIVGRALSKTQAKFPMVEVRRMVIMPDHIHLVLAVTKDNSPHLGTIVGFFAGRCTWGLRQLLSPEAPSYFEEGFHDWIVYRRGQMKSFCDYVSDNPRRLLIKRLRPDLFSVGQILIADGKAMKTKGNIFLLRHPLRVQVRWSSKISAEEWERRCELYRRIISQGGVLISPFIHPKEKEFMNLGIAEGAGIVLLVNNGFRSRSAPHGRLFELTAEGRALILAPPDYDPEKKGIQRGECLQLNDWAEYFATTDPEYCLRNAPEPRPES